MNNLDDGLWIKFNSNLPPFRCGQGDYTLMLSKPMYSLEQFRTRGDFYQSRWKVHFDILESILHAITSVQYFCEVIPSIVEMEFASLAEQELMKPFALKSHKELLSGDSNCKSTMVEINANACHYYFVVGGIWGIISSTASIVEFFCIYCRNIARCSKTIKDDLKQVQITNNIPQDLLEYLDDLSSWFNLEAEQWQKYAKRQKKREGSILWHRGEHHHSNQLCRLYLHVDKSVASELSFSYSSLTWLNHKVYDLNSLIKDVSELTKRINSFVDSVFDLEIDRREKYNVTQLIQGASRYSEPKTSTSGTIRTWIGKFQ